MIHFFFFQFHLLVLIWLKIKLHDLFCLLFIRLSWSHEGILLYPSSQNTIRWNNVLLFSFYFFFVSINLFFLIFFNINFFLFSYHSFMTRPCNQTHIQGSWVWCCSQTQDSWAALQTNLLKLKSCNFNIVINIKNNIICIINITISIIINIINITLRLSVAAISKTLGFSFANRPN